MARRHHIASCLLFLLLCAVGYDLSAGESAVNWTVEPDGSQLEFQAEVQNNPFRGRFNTFEARIRFDPKAPESGKIDVTVDLASLSTGDAQSGMTARSAAWLAAREFRYATFTSRSIVASGPDRFTASGDLTLKNTAVPIELEFTLSASPEGRATAKGSVLLDRTAFSVGPPKSGTTPVGNAVEVTFTLNAVPRN